MLTSRRALRFIYSAAVVFVSLASCSSEPTSRLEDVTVKLVRVTTVVDPTDLAVRRDDDKLYIATRPGRIYTVPADDPGESKPSLFLDITSEVEDLGAKPGRGGEAGLLALTFSPDGSRLYLTYTAPSRSTRPKSVEWKLVEFRVNGSRVDRNSERSLIQLHKDKPHHNAGDLAFGPDGYLYTGLGDGWPFSDEMNTGQDPSDLFASIWRLDPTTGDGRPYSIPSGNPFADGSGAPEVWLYGARNPWRFSFDRDNGDLWIGDAGEHLQEEIDFLPAENGRGRGANLGWRNMEGTAVTKGMRPPPNHVPPVFTYDHTQGCAIIGGYVYRGGAIDGLRGAYIFTDYCKGSLRAIMLDSNDVVHHSLGVDVMNPSSFGEGADAELYVLSLAGGVYRIEPG